MVLTDQATTRGDRATPMRLAGKRAWRYTPLGRFLREPSAVFGAFVMCVLLITAIGAPLLAPHDPALTNLRLRNMPPPWEAGGSTQHLLGTDPVGRDILSRIIYGARVSLSISLIVTLLAAAIGILLGLLAGYYGGWLDQVVMRIADLFLAFPFILLAITIIAVLGAGIINLIVVFVVAGWVSYARLVRGQVLSIKQAQYVEAVRVAGARDSRVLMHHILPNVIAPVIVLATLQIGGVVLAESALSFLGLGVNPSTPTWGTMINEGRLYFYNAWWVITFPGLAILIAVLGINMFGDWLRDVLDPTSQQV
ncbi:MAG: ABC transporter permease [Chloroflexota bacterium]|nr:ABC transporter permease [Chloroflexota bacterium]